MKQNPSPESLDERIARLEEESRRLQKELAVLRADKLLQTLLKTERDGYLPRENRTVIRTGRGLTVNGTRLTLYLIRDSLNEENSLKNVRDSYELTDEEMLDILDYIHLNKEEFEKEYQQILESAEEHRKYWEERNRDVMEKNRERSEATIARLREWSKQYHAKEKHEDAA
ncbi:MAG: hypothetical protein Q7J80_16055 [Anaerolineales bacterium]|nr:hypothetical protein [Anaerolineales bacterium]